MTESFEDVCASYDYCTWIGRNGVKAAISRLQRAHEAEIAELQGQYERKAIDLQKAHKHEMEQLRRSRFREGYEAGQRSMDAEHYAVVLRLKHLPLDEDSHGNLSQIARAIWHSDFGWTEGACAALRDELVRLLGGVHDEPAPIPASRCACDADCDCGHGDEASVAYDELGNERRKAVCELRNVQMNTGNAVKKLAIALGVKWNPDNAQKSIALLQSRLIHLLGGDEPLPNSSKPNLTKSAETAKPESDDGGENCRITDELRKFKGHINAGLTPEMVLALRTEVNFIADRIDEQFNRICWQQEAVLQHTIDTMVEERDKLVDNRDMWRGKAMQLTDVVDRYVGRYEDVLELLRDAASEYQDKHHWVQVWHDRAEDMQVERDELQKELEDARAALNVAVGRWAKADAEKRELQERLDEYEQRDTAESIVRDIHLGKVTDSQAVERIRALP